VKGVYIQCVRWTDGLVNTVQTLSKSV